MRLRLTIEYQGTRYHGWQGQTNARTVQGELIRAATAVFGRPVDVQGSGRTDAGVHALGQVAHLDALPPLAPERVLVGLNDRLPQDVNVLDARTVPARFHARHDAAARSYLYQISRRRTAFGKPFVWWVKDPLDMHAMSGCAAGLRGMRDFAGFADKRVEKDTSTRVLVQEAVVAEAGDLILVRLRASHFLWKMVRRVVGCLVGVGRGELSAAAFERLFREPSPYPAKVTAPPSGLFLEEVIYPGEQFTRPLVPVLAVAPSAVMKRGGRRYGSRCKAHDEADAEAHSCAPQADARSATPQMGAERRPSR